MYSRALHHAHPNALEMFEGNYSPLQTAPVGGICVPSLRQSLKTGPTNLEVKVLNPIMATHGEIDTSGLVLTVQRGPPTAASGHAHLEIIKDRVRVGVVLAGGRDVTVLGRNSTMSHGLLDHQSISRRHAALVHNGDGDVFVADLGSTHGTYVNGCKLPAKTAKRLSDGDILMFGESSRCVIFWPRRKRYSRHRRTRGI